MSSPPPASGCYPDSVGLNDPIGTYIKRDPGRPHPVKITLEHGWQAVPPGRIHGHDRFGLSQL